MHGVELRLSNEPPADADNLLMDGWRGRPGGVRDEPARGRRGHRQSARQGPQEGAQGLLPLERRVSERERDAPPERHVTLSLLC